MVLDKLCKKPKDESKNLMVIYILFHKIHVLSRGFRWIPTVLPNINIQRMQNIFMLL
jgi:hypothetical protein